MREINDFDGYFQNFEYGYQKAVLLANHLGLNYGQFVIVLSAFGLFLISSTIALYTRARAFVVTLYFLYPFLMDIVQVRNFICMAIVIYFSRFLFKDGRRATAIYILGVLIAASFQVAGYFYLVLVLCKLKSPKAFFGLVAAMAAGMALFIFAVESDFTLPFFQSIPYLEFRTSTTTRIAYAVYFGFGYCLVDYCRACLRKAVKVAQPGDLNAAASYSVMGKRIYYINVTLLLVYPLMYYSVDFIRLHRNMQILNYILYALVITSPGVKYRPKIGIGISAVVFAAISGWTYAYYIGSDLVFYPIMENNWLFDFSR